MEKQVYKVCRDCGGLYPDRLMPTEKRCVNCQEVFEAQKAIDLKGAEDELQRGTERKNG